MDFQPTETRETDQVGNGNLETHWWSFIYLVIPGVTKVHMLYQRTKGSIIRKMM